MAPVGCNGARMSEGSCGRSPTCRGALRHLCLCVVVGALAELLLLGAAVTAAAAPYVPVDDALIIERLPVAADPSLRELRRFHAALSRSPQDLALALRVA